MRDEISKNPENLLNFVLSGFEGERSATKDRPWSTGRPDVYSCV